MDTIQKRLEKLQDKKTWIRQGLTKWLEIWADATPAVEGEMLKITGLNHYMATDISYFIVPGSDSLHQGYYDAVKYNGVDGLDEVRIERVPIEDIRSIISALPKRLEDYEKVLEEDIDELEQMMSKLLPSQ